MKKTYFCPKAQQVNVKVERCCIGVSSQDSDGSGSLSKAMEFDEEDEF